MVNFGYKYTVDFFISTSSEDKSKINDTLFKGGTTHYYFDISKTFLYKRPAMMAPKIGAIQNNHNCPKAQSPTNSAWLVLRAGLTEVFVTGILIRRIKVSENPIAIPARPFGAFL